MNAKQTLVAASLLVLTSTAAFAADTTTVAPKTRAEVIAELVQARANGEELGAEGYAWYQAQRAVLASKANTETKMAAEKSNADQVATAKTQKAQQN
ncbi:DUF4148 domain-containing protein [Undibacterium sp. TJN19]|uniref:DUF4148 domain-containing protein n=1 Tax=Undibacterium sp. TJN19 TaxID=3413055 RepID=UPI003BF2B0EA